MTTRTTKKKTQATQFTTLHGAPAQGGAPAVATTTPGATGPSPGGSVSAADSVATAQDAALAAALPPHGISAVRSFADQQVALFAASSTQQMLRTHADLLARIKGFDVEASIANAVAADQLLATYDRMKESVDRVAQALRARLTQVRSDGRAVVRVAATAAEGTSLHADSAGFVAQWQGLAGVTRATATRRRQRNAAQSAATAQTGAPLPRPTVGASTAVAQGPAQPATDTPSVASDQGPARPAAGSTPHPTG